jgi:hypothetical protein
MGIQNASKKWTMPIWNWSLTISQLVILFEGRLDDSLNLRSHFCCSKSSRVCENLSILLFKHLVEHRKFI